jgi:hypothetical protein
MHGWKHAARFIIWLALALAAAVVVFVAVLVLIGQAHVSVN